MTIPAVVPLTALLALAPCVRAQRLDASPASAPGDAVPSQAALEGLAEVVRGWVEEEKVVGAELLVISDRRTVLHRAWGWKDREEQIALEPGAVFNLRSMTKPVLGTAAQLLLEEGLVTQGQRVADHLPAFAQGPAREITLEQLLTHRSGLPWNVCTDGPSLAALATCCAQVGPREFLPGTSFRYSNAGSNVLGAALAAVTGLDLDELLDARVLAPLGMLDTFSLEHADDPRLARCASRYVRTGTGTRSWSPAQGAPLDFLQGAQGLAGTAHDYARLLRVWLDDGELDGVQVLPATGVQRGLTPASLTALPTTFPGRRVYYGQHWKLWSRASGDEVEAFGHSGSDGTFAWAWPERDLMVLYMTQCVDTPTGIELEREIDRWLLDEGDPEVPPDLIAFVGHYWNEDQSMIRSVYASPAGELRLDVVGTGIFRLERSDDPLRFGVSGRPGFDVRFERGSEGAIERLVPPEATGEGASTRLEGDPGLPSVDELIALRFGGAQTGSPGDLGVFRMSGTFTHSSGIEGTDVLLSDGELRSREEVGRSRRGAESTICNGKRVGVVSARGRLRELSGPERDQLLQSRMAVVGGDWRRFFARLEVVHRSEREGREVLLLRATGGEAPPTTFVVDAESGLPIEAITALELPFGSMGKRTRLEDWRQVEGVWLPFRWVGSFASDSMGTATVQYETIETHLEPDAGAFEIVAPTGR